MCEVAIWYKLFWFWLLLIHFFFLLKQKIISQNENPFPRRLSFSYSCIILWTLWCHLTSLKKSNSQVANRCQLQNRNLQYINLLTFALGKYLMLFIYKSLSAVPCYNVIYSKCCIYWLISVYSLWHLRCSKRIHQGLSSAPCWSLDRHFCLKYM